MSRMKRDYIRRGLCVFAAMMVLCVLFSGCTEKERMGKQQAEEQTPVQTEPPRKLEIAALKGPTAIGMVSLMDEAEQLKTADHYSFTIAASADAFTASLLKGEIQIAAVPCNTAAALYNKSGGKIKVLGINTLGVLYILEKGMDVQSVEDLKGRTIYTTGKGTTPEYTLRHLLKSAGLDPDRDVSIEFKSEASEVAVLMAQNRGETVAMLPQPYAATVMMNNSQVRIALDVTAEWEKRTEQESTVVTGVVAVNADYYEKNRAAVDEFVRVYKASVSFVNADIDSAARLTEHFGIFKEEVARQAIPYCNITYIEGSEMKQKINGYLRVLYDENPAAVGGQMPDDAFYAGLQ